MALSDELRRQLDPLYRALSRSRNCVLPVVGSGLSQGLPTWKALLEGLVAEVPDVAERADFMKDLDGGKYLEVASDLEHHLAVGRTRVSTRIQELYQRPERQQPAKSRPKSYDSLVVLPCEHFITTNYDPWLKDALASKLSAAPRSYGPTDRGAFSDIGHGSAPLVLMIHGDADRPNDCVLSYEGYRALLQGSQAWRDGMKALVAHRALLFVGYSLEDPDILYLLDEWQAVYEPSGGASTRHWLLSDKLTERRMGQLRRRGVEPIAYGDHALLAEVLEYLARPPSAGHSATSSDPDDQAIRSYLVKLRDETASIEIQGIGTKYGQSKGALAYPIEDLYTPLRTRTWRAPRKGNVPSNKDLDAAQTLGHGGHDSLVELSEILPLHQHLLIEGQPGAGKTTFLRLVANLLARDALGEPCPTGRTWGKQRLGLGEASGVVPLFVRASSFVSLLSETSLDRGDRATLVRLISKLCCDDGEHIPAKSLAERLEQGRAVLLLDGIDEVADASLRKVLLGMVRDAKRRWKCRIIISSRPIETEELCTMGFAKASVEPFGQKEIGQFVERWVRGLRSSDGIADESARAAEHRSSLLDAILGSSTFRVLAENPVMLTCLCVVHFNEGSLPDGRARLYESVIKWLLEARRKQREAAGYDNEFARQAFARLAREMMLTDKGKQSSLSFCDAVKLICPELERQFPGETKEGLWRRGEAWLTFECEASGIVQQLTGKQLRFWHLTFQEYLAALHLSWNASLSEDWWPIVRDHLDDPQWRETIDVLPGCLFDGPGRGKVDDLLERLVTWGEAGAGLTTDEQQVGVLDPSDGKLIAFVDLLGEARLAAVLGRMLLPLGVYQYKTPVEIQYRYEGALKASMAIFVLEGAGRVPVKLRIEVAEALGRAGDPRLAEGRDNFIEVPGMGVKLGKYPVTIEEYQRFVNGRGYEESKYWDAEGWAHKEKEGWTEPLEWEQQLNAAAANRPVTYVSWCEADAYCKWLSAQQDRVIRLPSEAEWEAAARSPQGAYPWGAAEPCEELANFARSGGSPNVRRPTPVGIYLAGNGPFGHCDLAGNVHEWCADLLDHDEEGISRRPLRGGSWYNQAEHLRSSCRFRSRADNRGSFVGFRCVLSAPSLEY